MSSDHRPSPGTGISIAVTGCRGVPATWGGVEHHCENLYSRLAAMGYDITVYARNYYVPKDTTGYKGLRIKRLPTLNFKYTDALLHTFLCVLHILFGKAQIVHIHGIGPAFFSWIPRLLRPRMKIFFTCHGLDWQRRKWPLWASKLIYLGELSAVRYAHRRIVVSRDLQGHFASVHGIETTYIPNGIEPRPPRPPNRIRQWNLTPRGYFLWVGRIVPEKRVEDLIRAYLTVPRRFPLVIVGDQAAAGAYMSELKQLAGKTPAILFLGYQFGETVEELFSNARGFLSPSELEGLPITLLEALSYGTICAISDIGPHREVTESLPSLSFPVGDIAAISRCLDRVEAMDEQEFNDFSRQAVSMISERFSWETVCSEHDRLYREALTPPET